MLIGILFFGVTHLFVFSPFRQFIWQERILRFAPKEFRYFIEKIQGLIYSFSLIQFSRKHNCILKVRLFPLQIKYLSKNYISANGQFQSFIIQPIPIPITL